MKTFMIYHLLLLLTVACSHDLFTVNKRILLILSKLENHPLISDIQIQNNKISLERKPFEYNSTCYFSEVKNYLNEPLPNQSNNKYFDLHPNLLRYDSVNNETKQESLKSYSQAMSYFENYINQTWAKEKFLRKKLKLDLKNNENATKILIENLEEKSFVENLSMKFSVQSSSLDILQNFLSFINEKVDLVVVSAEELEEEEDEEEEQLKFSKKCNRRNKKKCHRGNRFKRLGRNIKKFFKKI